MKIWHSADRSELHADNGETLYFERFKDGTVVISISQDGITIAGFEVPHAWTGELERATQRGGPGL